MAKAYNTLDGLIQLNDKNLADLSVTDLLEEAPLLKVLHAQVASNGTQHKYLKQTTASSAAFRDAPRSTRMSRWRTPTRAAATRGSSSSWSGPSGSSCPCSKSR